MWSEGSLEFREDKFRVSYLAQASAIRAMTRGNHIFQSRMSGVIDEVSLPQEPILDDFGSWLHTSGVF